MCHCPGVYRDELGPKQVVHLTSVEATNAKGFAQWIVFDYGQFNIPGVEKLVPLHDDVLAQ